MFALLQRLSRALTRTLLSGLFLGCLLLGLTACGGTPAGLSGSYVDDTVAVAQALLESINTPGDGPDRAQQQSQAKTLINDYVALYRPNRSVNGLASFTTMQTALNSLAGNYVSYANRPLPEALQQRISKELHQAQTTAVRGS